MAFGLHRYQHEGHLHFLTFSCHRRLPYLNSKTAYTRSEHWLETLRKRHNFDVHGYVLMPEHVHLLLSEPTQHTLDNTIRALKGQTSKNLKGDRDHFWQKRYYDFNVFTEKKRIEKLKYMHRNPVVRGLVPRPEDWPWSSFRHYATGEQGRVEIESPWTAHRREHPRIATQITMSGAPGIAALNLARAPTASTIPTM